MTLFAMDIVHSQALTLVAISTERLVAVAYPLFYFKHRKSIHVQWLCVLGIQVYCILSALGLVVKDLLVDANRVTQMLCFKPWVSTILNVGLTPFTCINCYMFKSVTLSTLR